MSTLFPAAPCIRDLSALDAPRLAARPAGFMAPYLSRRFSVAELDDPDKVMAEDRPLLSRVRAFEVPCLVGRTFEFKSPEELPEPLVQLLQRVWPSVPWKSLDRNSWPVFLKYRFVHANLPAPPDLTTGQPMSLEVYATLQSVDGIALDSPAGQAWEAQQRISFTRQLMESANTFPSVQGSAFVVRIDAAVYTNVKNVGAGMPVYM